MWITRCLAEAAEETAAVAETSGGFDIIDIILFAVGAYFLLMGIMTVVTKKFYGNMEKNYDKYTTESVQSCINLIGIQNALVGLFLIAFEGAGLLGWTWPQRLILAGVFIVIIILVGLPMNRKLIKK